MEEIIEKQNFRIEINYETFNHEYSVSLDTGASVSVTSDNFFKFFVENSETKLTLVSGNWYINFQQLFRVRLKISICKRFLKSRRLNTKAYTVFLNRSEFIDTAYSDIKITVSITKLF